jgi:hypothetical protein
MQYFIHHRKAANSTFMQQTGFMDTVAVIREATVRAIVLLSPKVWQLLDSKTYSA